MSRFEMSEEDIEDSFVEEGEDVYERKDNEDEDVMPVLLPFLVSLQTNTQLYHWHINVYNKHVISDELYKSLLKSTDSFVEVLQGGLSNGSKLSFDKESLEVEQKSTKEFLDYLNKCIKKINNLKNIFKEETHLVNILDDMITSINIAVYKLKLE